MKIEIAKISQDGSAYTGEEAAEVLGLEGDSLVKVTGGVSYDLHAQFVSHELVVKGKVEAPARLQCSRCAEFYSTTLIESAFLRAYEVKAGQEEVDLTEDLREAILLTIPPYPTCSPDCKGLCPYCGKNRNEGECNCRPPSRDGGWGGLEGLKLKDK